MYYTYIIQSEKNGRYYIGHTADIEQRIIRHNAGATPSTKAARPWKLVYAEEYSTKSEAYNRERDIKKKKSRVYIEQLIEKSKAKNSNEERPD